MYRPVFTSQPESWQEWWTAVRAFTAAWYDVPAGEVRGHNPVIEALEREAGIAISPSVHEWASFADELQRAGLFERAMRDDLTLSWVPGSNAFRLLTIAEGDVEWVVLREHLADEDPPVESRQVDDRDGQPLETWPHASTTSEFALQQLLAYLRPAGGGSFTVDMTLTPALIDQLRGIGQTSINVGRQTLIEDDDLLIMAGESPYAPEGCGSIEILVGASRTNSVPTVLTDLAHGRGGWLMGAFAENRDQ